MVSQGIADPSRMAIKGGSSGGFTVLNALADHPGLFRAGISNYGGVTDLCPIETDHARSSPATHSPVALPQGNRPLPFAQPRQPWRVHPRSPGRLPRRTTRSSSRPGRTHRRSLKQAGIPHHYRVRRRRPRLATGPRPSKFIIKISTRF
ncbi:MAG: prolyl oligopeptidase family serine peptidase [Fibrobacteres bacterium]|nr:prolyl oligopeptidase family serine peptidase [Fibrobacterota bacterium]